MSNLCAAASSHECDAVAGHFTDPYTGKQMDYAAEGSQIQTDHLIPMAAAWDLGAANWSQGLRERFANDTQCELLAVNGGANMSKGDSTPHPGCRHTSRTGASTWSAT